MHCKNMGLKSGIIIANNYSSEWCGLNPTKPMPASNPRRLAKKKTYHTSIYHWTPPQYSAGERRRRRQQRNRDAEMPVAREVYLHQDKSPYYCCKAINDCLLKVLRFDRFAHAIRCCNRHHETGEQRERLLTTRHSL